MPRTVPFRTLNPMFAWTGWKSIPCSANSRTPRAHEPAAIVFVRTWINHSYTNDIGFREAHESPSLLSPIVVLPRSFFEAAVWTSSRYWCHSLWKPGKHWSPTVHFNHRPLRQSITRKIDARALSRKLPLFQSRLAFNSQGENVVLNLVEWQFECHWWGNHNCCFFNHFEVCSHVDRATRSVLA